MADRVVDEVVIDGCISLCDSSEVHRSGVLDRRKV